jgi:signal transduction histidine kinase
VEANVEADKSHMTPENYEDTVDVLSMLRGNLRKVGEHGLHTTRTLKAMEEMLKDRSGGIVQMDLIPVLRQDEQMFLTYYADSIAAYHVAVDFTLPEGNISINGNGEQLSKAIMSILGNAIYAVVKKAQRCHYTPRVALTAATADGQAVITIFDNGIGIEQTILNKVFDPFFTTKPTGEASGVGLYLSHEIIQNHSGQITLKSQKDEYTEVTITIPLI